MCREWRSYEAFAAWSDENGYTDDLSIDRIDNDGPYAPSNCRWADARTQSDNTSKIRRFDLNGKSMTLREISESYGVKSKTIDARLRRGWTIGRAAKP